MCEIIREAIMKNKILVLIVSLEIIFCGCVTINENITSTPSEAHIYWGKTENDLKATGHKTPFYRSITGEAIEPWCYRVEKNGYQLSKIICKPKQTTDRNVNFILVAEKDVQPTVSVTGAAGALKRITTSELTEHYPRLSPDRQWLLVEVSGNEPEIIKRRVIEKINLSTGVKVILTSQDNNSREGDWLPDSSAIVFSSDRMNNYTIVKSFGITGETAVRFISNPVIGSARFPSVSPDGKDIAFSIYTSPDDNQICIVGIDGYNLRVYGPGFFPKWSPDGKTLLFVRKVGGYMHIYSINIKSGGNLVELCSARANDFGVSWSPDGKYLSFISDRVGDYRHLFLIQSDGRDLTQLTDGKFNVYTASWEKDGFIYFSANAGGNIDIWRLKPKTE